MIVLHPNEQQYNALNGYTNGVYQLIFAIDGSGRYIVGLEVLNDPNFSEIYEQLLELEQITYTPIEE
jgi:hypothetical protein